MIATRTRLNLKTVKIPQKLSDNYFKRIKPKRPKKEEGDIFAVKEDVSMGNARRFFNSGHSKVIANQRNRGVEPNDIAQNL